MARSEKQQPKGFRGAGWALAVVAAAALAFLFLEEEPPAPKPAASTEPIESPATSEVPPFYRSAEAAMPFPALQDPGRYEIAMVSKGYRIAHEIEGVLAQQPCYCNCGDAFGHGSLLDCFATDHGAT